MLDRARGQVAGVFEEAGQGVEVAPLRGAFLHLAHPLAQRGDAEQPGGRLGLVGDGLDLRPVAFADGAFQGVLLAPIPRDAIYLGKVISNVVLVSVVVALTVAVFGLFFQLDYGTHPVALALTLFLGVVGFVALATLFGAVTAGTSLGEALLPVLLFPLLVPLVVYGVGATGRLLQNRPLAEVEGNIRILGAFAVACIAIGAVLFRHVVED